MKSYSKSTELANHPYQPVSPLDPAFGGKKAFNMTLEELKRHLQKTNLKWQTGDNGHLVGFTVGQGVWHWFTHCGTTIMFDHAYSMNTGKTKRGRAQRIKSINSLKCKGVPIEDIL